MLKFVAENLIFKKCHVHVKSNNKKILNTKHQQVIYFIMHCNLLLRYDEKRVKVNDFAKIISLEDFSLQRLNWIQFCSTGC